jgi:hypothetical protein
MKTKLILASLALTSLPALAGPPPVAPMAPPPPTEQGWQFRFAPYLWAQSLDGTAGVGLTGDVDVSFNDILDDLDFAFMGAFEARHGRWGILADVSYAELSDSLDPLGVVFSQGDFEMQQFLGNITLNYRMLENDKTVVDLYAGARLNWIDLDITAGGKVGVAAVTGDDFWADAIIGARFQTSLGGPWFFRASGDIGAGESDFTWQAIGLFGYKLNDSCNIGLGYRGVGTDYQNGAVTWDVTAHGPVLGVEWHW